MCQSLKGKQPKEACDGLYADITDDSLQQKTIFLQEGVTQLIHRNQARKNNSPGLHTLTRGVQYWNSGTDRLNLERLFSGSAESKGESLWEQYKSYKENYVKYKQFDPETPNLS